MSDTIKLALVGCGGMMGAHSRGMERLWPHGIRPFQVVATCDVMRESAEKMAAHVASYQGEKPAVFTDLVAMLKEMPEIDAVDISVQHDQHHTTALPCIAAGKHVLIEKPLAMTMRSGKAILDAAGKSGKAFMVAENYRRSPEERAINWAIKSGRIGKLRQLYWIDVGESLGAWGWRDRVEIAGGGWSMDGGVHFADLFRYHIGPVESMYAVSKQQNPTRYLNRETMSDPVEATVEDCTMAVLTFENGVVGTWISSKSAPGKSFNSRVLYGEKGSITWGAGLETRDEKVTIAELVEQYRKSLSPAESARLFPAGMEDTIAIELTEFADAINSGRAVETNGIEGYKALAISLSIYESEATSAQVRLADVEALKVEAYQQRFNALIGAG